MGNILKDIKEMSDLEFKEYMKSLDEEETTHLMYDWEGVWARDNQKEPLGGWVYWLILAGRGWGKSATGSYWIRKRVANGARRLAVIGPTAADVRDIMVEGPSGILESFPPQLKPYYEPSKRRITFDNGAIAITYSGDEPDRLRGANIDSAWVDELSSCRYAQDVMDMLSLGLRIGEDPRCIITTTPKPIKPIKELLKQKNVHLTRGSTYENRDNLSPVFFDSIISRFENTRLGRQELYAEILDDAPGALWSREQLEQNRVSEMPDLKRIVVGVDPAITSKKDSDETGIVVAGLGTDNHFYVLDDKSCIKSPHGWGKEVVATYNKWKADRVVGEVNQGGDMVKAILNTISPFISFRAVHATRGKKLRAEPIASLYEQNRIKHVGYFGSLEDQMCSWEPGVTTDSPDRIDSLCLAIFELMKNSQLHSMDLSGITDFKRNSPYNI
jgi:phage terminase large subunit-like protein